MTRAARHAGLATVMSALAACVGAPGALVETEFGSFRVASEDSIMIMVAPEILPDGTEMRIAPAIGGLVVLTPDGRPATDRAGARAAIAAHCAAQGDPTPVERFDQRLSDDGNTYWSAWPCDDS